MDLKVIWKWDGIAVAPVIDLGAVRDPAARYAIAREHAPPPVIRPGSQAEQTQTKSPHKRSISRSVFIAEQVVLHDLFPFVAVLGAPTRILFPLPQFEAAPFCLLAPVF